jgi:large subunit ribosomal protein L17
MDTEQRTALWRNLTIALFTHGQITTTLPKAKGVKPFVEKLITKARKGDLASRRQVIAKLGGNPIQVGNDKDESVERNNYGEVVGGTRIVKKLFDEIAPRYADRAGGYTRIIKLAKHRIGDGSDLCVLQLVGDEQGPQLSGEGARRRKADKRAVFAAKLRKGKAAAATEAPAAEAQPEQPQA